MALTETKRKYLLTIALLNNTPAQPFRPIDLAIRLGVSRASVSRMLLAFVKEGLLIQKDHTYQLSDQGLSCINASLTQYQTCHKFCTQMLQLSAFDANECCIALLCTLPSQTLAHLDRQITSMLTRQ